MARLDELDLPNSVRRRLRRAHIDTVEKLIAQTEHDPLTLPGIGPHMVTVIHKSLAEFQQLTRTGGTTVDNSTSTDIEVLNLPRWIVAYLRWKRLDTVERLVGMNEDTLGVIADLSPTGLQELQHRLQVYLHQELEPEGMPISHINLSTRTYNALSRAGVSTKERLSAMSDDELLSIRQFGVKCLSEVHEALSAFPEISPVTESDGLHDAASADFPATRETDFLSIEQVLERLIVQTPIDRLALSVRPRNALQRCGVNTVEHLVLLSDEQMLAAANFGTKSLEETHTKLAAYLEQHPLPPEYVALADQYRNGMQRHLRFERTAPPVVFPSPSSQLVDPHLLEQVSHIPLDKISISRLVLPDYLSEGLTRLKILTIQTLVDQDPTILAESGLIRERVDWYLRLLLTSDENTWHSEVIGRSLSLVCQYALQTRSIHSYITEWFADLSEREQQVLRGRYGLQTEELTLEQMGKQFGVTRERVRQIQTKAERRLAYPASFNRIAPLANSFRYALDAVGGVANVRDIGRSLRDYLVLGDYGLAGVLSLVFEIDTGVEYLRGQQVWIRQGISRSEVRETQKLLVAFLSEAGVPLSDNQLVQKLKSTEFFRRHSGTLTDDLIKACLRVDRHLRRRGDEWYLRKRGWQRLAGIIRALREIGEPAHYEEIAERANALLPQHLARTAHNIHAELGRRSEIFIRVGHGVFGLAEWGLSDDGSVANAAFRILSEAGKPLHYDLVTNQVLETWRVRPESVYAALSTDERFRSLGGGVFWLSEQDVPGESLGFGSLFGSKLAQMQREIDEWHDAGEYDTHTEVDRIREVGTDIFGE